MMPSASAWKFTSSRWRSTGSATRVTSSGAGTGAAVEQRRGFGAEEQRLARARADAPAHPVLHRLRAPSDRRAASRE